jgi:hypothetical protein
MEKDYPNGDLNRPVTVLSMFYSNPLQILFFSSDLSISQRKVVGRLAKEPRCKSG